MVCQEVIDCEFLPTTPHLYDNGFCISCGKLDPDAILLGDVNGDGIIHAKDYMMLKRYALGTYELSADRLPAADVTREGKINAKDYMMLKRHVLGTYVIAQ